MYACVMCVWMRVGPACSHRRGIFLPCNSHLRALDGAKRRVADAAVVHSGELRSSDGEPGPGARNRRLGAGSRDRGQRIDVEAV